jgi:hypothetical protein
MYQSNEPHELREQELPAAVRDALAAARAARPGADVLCLCFHTIEGNHDIVRLTVAGLLAEANGDGPVILGLRRKDVLVLTVTVTETAADRVQTITHVLVTRLRRRLSRAG